MASQILTAIVLPAGLTASGALQANIYLAPRLSGAADLSSFPDWLAWPELVSEHGLAFDLQCGSSVATVPAAPGPLRPDIWAAIFTPATPVQPYPQPGYSQRLFVSYPAADALSYLKYAYLSVATAQEPSVDLFQQFLTYLMFRKGRESTIDAVLSALRVSLWQEQHPAVGIQIQEGATTATASVPPPPQTRRSRRCLTPPTNALMMARQFALYHHLPLGTRPSTAAQLGCGLRRPARFPHCAELAERSPGPALRAGPGIPGRAARWLLPAFSARR